MMINLVPEELRKEEKKKEKEEKEEIKMSKPEMPLSPPSPPSEPVEPVKPKIIPPPPPPPPSPPLPRMEISKVEPVKEPEKRPIFEFKRPEEIFVSKEKPKPREEKPKKVKLEEEWTLPKIEEEKKDLPEISLAPSKIVILPRMVRKQTLIFLISMTLMLLAFTLIWWWTNKNLENSVEKINKIQVEIEAVEKEIEPLEGVKQKIAGIEAKFGKAQKVLVNHLYWTNFFKLLEKHTIPEVFFRGFSANVSGSIHLNAQAKDLPSVGRQIIALQEAGEFIEKVDVSNINVGGEAVTFSLEITLKPDVFFFKK